jgi:hypothetical protein
MNEQQHHEGLIGGLQEQLKPVLEASTQPMYGYLDDNHMFCNAKFAKLLGYGSKEEWANAGTGSFLNAFVVKESQQALQKAFQDATEHMAGSLIKIAWKRKDGAAIEAPVILVPISYNGHIFALHFITA